MLALTVSLALLQFLPHTLASGDKTPTAAALSVEIKKHLQENTNKSFQVLLDRWSDQHGARAAQALVTIATDRHQNDPARFIASLGAVRLGGAAISEKLVGNLADRSWMVRNGALQALGAALALPSDDLKKRKQAQLLGKICDRLFDKALVVRLQAADTLKRFLETRAGDLTSKNQRRLHQAAWKALRDKRNYTAGHSQWVPLRVLELFDDLPPPPKETHELAAVLEYPKDHALMLKAFQILERSTGAAPPKKTSIQEQVAFWKTKLQSRS